MARLLPRTNQVLLGLVRPVMPAGVSVGSRIPDRMLLPFVMVRRSGGSAIHPEQLDRAVVDAQTWAADDTTSEELAQLVRDALYRASRSPQVIVPGAGYLSWYEETSAPVEIPADTEDHEVYRYQATYTVNVRPARG